MYAQEVPFRTKCLHIVGKEKKKPKTIFITKLILIILSVSNNTILVLGFIFNEGNDAMYEMCISVNI